MSHEIKQHKSHPYLAIFIIGVAPIVLLVVGIFVFVGLSNSSVAVPNVVGQSIDSAREQLELDGLKVGKITPVSKNVEIGTQNKVVEQSPKSSTEVSSGTSIDLVVSDVTLPKLG